MGSLLKEVVMKSRRTVVVDAATFVMRSILSMVVVALKASYKTANALFLMASVSPFERKEPKELSISSEVITRSPSRNSSWRALKSRAV